jgi:hypothetical protein
MTVRPRRLRLATKSFRKSQKGAWSTRCSARLFLRPDFVLPLLSVQKEIFIYKGATMKQACLLLTLGAFLSSPAFGQTTNSATTTPAPATAPASTTAPAAATKAPTPAATGPLTPDEQKQMRTDRSEAMKANPDLAAESKDLDTKRKELQTKIDEAAAKIDPNYPALLARQNPGKKDDKKDKEPKEKEAKAPAPTTSATTNAPAATPPAKP